MERLAELALDVKASAEALTAAFSDVHTARKAIEEKRLDLLFAEENYNQKFTAHELATERLSAEKQARLSINQLR